MEDRQPASRLVVAWLLLSVVALRWCASCSSRSFELEAGGYLAVTSRQRELCRVLSRFGEVAWCRCGNILVNGCGFKHAPVLWAVAQLQGSLRFRLGCIGGFGKGRCQPVRGVPHDVVCMHIAC